MGATVERFYLLNIKASSLKVMVPCHNVGSVGLRRVVRNGEIQGSRLLSVSENGGNGDWKDRFKENSERMRTGSLLEVASVLKSLIALHQAKPLSFREKKMLERARYLLVSELAMARNCEEAKVEEILTMLSRSANCAFPKLRNSRLSTLFLDSALPHARNRVIINSNGRLSRGSIPQGASDARRRIIFLPFSPQRSNLEYRWPGSGPAGRKTVARSRHQSYPKPRMWMRLVRMKPRLDPAPEAEARRIIPQAER